MNSSLLRDLVEAAGLAAASAGAMLVFGPVALIVAGIGVVVLVEVTGR